MMSSVVDGIVWFVVLPLRIIDEMAERRRLQEAGER
jgi:hypothetical protein